MPYCLYTINLICDIIKHNENLWENIMKRTLWNITFASIITLAAYIVLYAIWGAILSELENPTLRLLIIALMTTVAFGFFLLYTSKIRKSIGEDEVVSDYKARKYVSFAEDFKLILKREFQMLICIVSIVFLCFALNTVDRLVFGEKTISFPTFIFAPMYLFDTMINISFMGYLLSAVIDCLAYIAFLLFYRRKKYNYWMKNKV